MKGASAQSQNSCSDLAGDERQVRAVGNKWESKRSRDPCEEGCKASCSGGRKVWVRILVLPLKLNASPFLH